MMAKEALIIGVVKEAADNRKCWLLPLFDRL